MTESKQFYINYQNLWLLVMVSEINNSGVTYHVQFPGEAVRLKQVINGDKTTTWLPADGKKYATASHLGELIESRMLKLEKEPQV